MLGIVHAVLILLRMGRGGALDLRLDHARFSAWIYECRAHGRVGNRAGGSRVPLDQDSTGAMHCPETHLSRGQTETATKDASLIKPNDCADIQYLSSDCSVPRPIRPLFAVPASEATGSV